MPRRKMKKNNNNDNNPEEISFIAHLPIKVNKKTENTNNNNKELEKLRKENKELKEKLALLIDSNTKNINVIKNEVNNKNNIKCWWCDSCNNNGYITLPEKKIGNKFYGIGKFCTLNCALSFNFDLKDEKVWDRYSLLCQYRDILYPDIVDFKFAPPKYVLKEFGGDKTRDEYYEELMTMKNDYIKLLPPMTSSTILIEQRKSGSKDLNKLQLLGIKLKRSKPLVNNSYSLDSIITL